MTLAQRGGRALEIGRVVSGSALLLAGLLAAPLGAQSIAITGGTVYPVSGPKIENGTVLVKDGRIVAVGRDVSIPSDARRIDARGKVVTPGLIHAQSAIALGVGRSLAEESDAEYTSIGGTTDGAMSGDFHPAFSIVPGIDPNALVIPVARMGGVTAALVLPDGGFVPGQATAVRLAGQHVEEMILRTPSALLIDLSDASRPAGEGSRAGAVARLRRLFMEASTLRQRRADFDANRMKDLSAPAAELEALYPVLDGKLPVYVNARRQSDIENAVRLAEEFHLQLVLRGGTEAWVVAPLLARAGVAVVLDSRDNIPSFDGLRARSDNAALLREAGVAVILAGQDPGGQMNLRFEAGQAVRNGMGWEDALAAITLAPARAFGVSDLVGALAPGLSADLVIWDGDPFEFSTGVTLLMIQGHEQALTSRMTELRDRYRTLPPKD